MFFKQSLGNRGRLLHRLIDLTIECEDYSFNGFSGGHHSIPKFS